MRRILLILVLVGLIAAPAVVSRAQELRTYVVQAGDNLFRISLRFGVSIAAIQEANGIANPNLIYVGQVLKIPGGTGPVPTAAPGATAAPSGTVGTYVVQPGDTLGRIAARFGTTVAAIAQANNIVNVNLIYVGQVLQIAGAPASTSGGANPTAAGPAPQALTGFELGGQVANLNSTTQAVMQSAKMRWVKQQVSAGDGGASGQIGQAHSLGFKILLSVIGDKNSVTSPTYQDGFAAYVGSLAQAGADAIEIWNEMNIDREWPTGQINPTSYVALLTKSYNAIKAVNGNTIVISGALAPTGAEGAYGLSRVWNDDRYYAGMATAGAGRVSDCIGVHYNEGIVSPLQTSGDPRGDNYPTRYFSTMLNRALSPFPGKVACFTELGYLSPEGYGPLPAGFAWAANVTVANQAEWLGQAAQRAAASGRVRLMIVFNVDFTAYGDDPQAGYAIIRPGGGCPACASLAAAVP
jgi:LysM repeat protein